MLRAYLGYHDKDLPRLLDLVDDDVDWSGDDGGRLHGRPAVSAYWTAQWQRVRAHDHPVAFTAREYGRTAVRVEQVVRAVDGSTPSTITFTHLHVLVDDRIIRMDLDGRAGRAS